MFQGKVKAKDLRGKKKDELLKQLDELKTVGDIFSIVDPLLAPLHLSLINPLLGTRWPFVYFLQGREFQDGRPKMGMCTEHGISVECMHGSECNKL